MVSKQENMTGDITVSNRRLPLNRSGNNDNKFWPNSDTNILLMRTGFGCGINWITNDHYLDVCCPPEFFPSHPWESPDMWPQQTRSPAQSGMTEWDRTCVWRAGQTWHSRRHGKRRSAGAGPQPTPWAASGSTGCPQQLQETRHEHEMNAVLGRDSAP